MSDRTMLNYIILFVDELVNNYKKNNNKNKK
jgi:hypothetical protein